MPEYLLIVKEDEAAHAAESPRAIADLIEAQAAFTDALAAEGKLRDRARFRPSGEGKRVTKGGVETGPFVTVSDYYWVTAASVEDAASLAKRCPILAADDIDVRPIMKGEVVPGKDTRSGKVFAHAVLGNAPNEAAWSDVMDRIDAATHDQFPSSIFLGGLRLERPTAGRRVAKSTQFDGPFLEAKEVIGGVFFLRLPNIDDAVRWAKKTRFLDFGTLEIRELWRM
jgi:hypothetical protein